MIKLKENTLEIIKSKNEECINCKRCFTVCPMMKEYSSSPKELMETIINDNAIKKEIPYSCMLCGLCKEKCPKDIDLKEMFYKIRSDIMSNNPNEIKELSYNTIKFHQINSFSPIFSRSFTTKETNKLFIPGCSLSSYSSEIVMKIYDYLKKYIDNISLSIECCGKPTLVMGDSYKFEKYYSKLNQMIEEKNISEIIVACPNCFDTIKNNSKDIKVTSIWSVINEYKIPKELMNYYGDLDKEFYLHDPCPMRNEEKIHDEVRGILNDLGIKVIEFNQNRENSECCGAGAMVRVTNPTISIEQTKKRANQAKTGSIISYCESCCESMLSVGKESLHILDFIFNEDVISKSKFTQDKTSVINKWKMRYETVQKGKYK